MGTERGRSPAGMAPGTCSLPSAVALSSRSMQGSGPRRGDVSTAIFSYLFARYNTVNLSFP